MDYRKFYRLEAYLFSEVGPNFRKTGRIEPLDFFLILVWKSNRAKGKHLKRLIRRHRSFSAAIKKLASEIHSAKNLEDRLQTTMSKKWGFRLPTATAILSVLYPDEAAMYDFRICDQLGEFDEIGDKKFSPALWDEYQRFVEAVKKKSPNKLETLREKDHYLWGKSRYEEARKDIGLPARR